MYNINFFKNIYDLNLLKKNWSIKSESEKKNIFENYIVVKKWQDIVWWYSLTDLNINGVNVKLLQCIYSNYKWVWSFILKKIKDEWCIFAYSNKENFFTKNGYIKLNIKSKSWANLFINY